MTYRDMYHPRERGLVGYDDWKSREPDEVCSCCGGTRVVLEIVPRGADWIEVEHPCQVCNTADDEPLDRDDDALPTEDTTGVREPD